MKKRNTAMLNEISDTIIDYKSALERIGGDQEFLDELLGIYIEEFTSSIGALGKALLEKDFKSIQEIGHSLKGSSANLSLLQLRDQAYLIEKAGRDNDLQLAEQSTGQLKLEFQRLEKHLEGTGRDF